MPSESEILREYARRQANRPRAPAFQSFEELFTHEEAFGLTTATPVQRSFCRVIDRKPLGELWDDPIVRAAFGGIEPTDPIKELMILAAIRTGKSMIGACLGLWATASVDINVGVRGGEIPRFSIVSLERDNANVTYTHFTGALKRPRLRPLLIEEPPPDWQDEMVILSDGLVANLFLWHKDGWPLEVRSVVGKRAGGSLVSRWSAGCVLSEAPRMVGALDGVVNYTDMRKAVLGRMLPGALLLSEGSPWMSYGPVYDIWKNEFGIRPRPTKNRVVVNARGPDVNPYWWTPERCEEIKESDPDAYRTDVEGQFIDVGEGLVSAAAVQQCTRPNADHIPFEEGHEYIAQMDPASSTNAWTFTIGDRVGNVRRCVYARQWKPEHGTPLRPKLVMQEAAEILKSYGLTWIYTDQFAAEALRDIAELFGISLVVVNWTGNEKTAIHLSMAALFNEQLMSIPNLPEMHKDLVLTTKRPGVKSVVLIHYQKTPDGRHCDYTPCHALMVRHWLPDVAASKPLEGTVEHWAEIEKAMVERETAALMGDGWIEHTPFN